MNAALGARRYAAMLADMALLSVARGMPPRDAIQHVVLEAMSDQALACDAIGTIMAVQGGETVARWYSSRASKIIRATRPVVGVASEVPLFEVEPGPETPDEEVEP